MTVTARFKLTSLVDYNSDSVQATFQAHTGKGSEDFQKYTPSGEIKMMLTKGCNALKMFTVGAVYDLAFNEAVLAEAGAAVKA